MLLPLALLAGSNAIRLEAENATLDGPHVVNVRPGYSGTGYVTDLTKTGARISWKVKAKAGIYEVKLGYSSPGEKGFEIGVNGSKSGGMLPPTGDQFDVKSAGKVELKNGENEISVERGWGYYDVDYVELSPAGKPTPVKGIKPKLSDPKATPEAKKLFATLLQQYGKATFSGQYDQNESDWIEMKTGKAPAILGGDLIDYSPSRTEHMKVPARDFVPRWIEASKAGQILTLSWHWNAPTDLIDEREHKKADGKTVDASWYKGFYTEATTFDAQKALADPTSERYKLLLRDIDTIAVQLKRLQDAHVPVLWRPLHEADGGWFWWGARGPETCKALWHLVYDRLTKVHNLHNLIWVWNSPKAAWYPGDDTVDIMSVDMYPSDLRDPLSPAWEEQLAKFNGRKPLALAEFPGAPDIERMRRFGVRWLYFVSWTGTVGPKSTAPAVLKSTYGSPYVINRHEP